MLNDVAMGRRKADLVLDGCSLVSVYTGEIVPDTQVAVVNGRIAYVGSDAAHTIGSKTTIIHLGGKYLVPGFADPHTHIDQFVMANILPSLAIAMPPPDELASFAARAMSCSLVPSTIKLFS